jgi:phosphatidylserine decarboxylase
MTIIVSKLTRNYESLSHAKMKYLTAFVIVFFFHWKTLHFNVISHGGRPFFWHFLHNLSILSDKFLTWYSLYQTFGTTEISSGELLENNWDRPVFFF